MSIIHHVEQGTSQWYALRTGRPTASQFHKILTPTGKPSSQARGYMSVYTDADPETVRLDRIADNKIPEFSAWDDELLKGELAMIDERLLDTLKSLDLQLTEAMRDPEPEPPANDDGPGDEPFITPADIERTVSRNVNDYYEVACNKCGNPMFVKRR